MTERDFSDAASRLIRAGSELPDVPRLHLNSISDQLDAIARSDFAAVFSDAHDDVTLEIFAPPELPFIRQAHGLKELHAAIKHNFEVVDDQRPQIREVFAEGDTVILFGTERGTVRETATPYHVEFVQRFTFRDGRLAALRIVAAHIYSE